MKVKFQNDFRLAGFSRKRFIKGVCDVPDALRKLLPRTAVILENYLEPEEQAEVEDQLRAADVARATKESSDPKALAQAGMAGFVDVDSPSIPKRKRETLSMPGTKKKGIK